MYNRFYSLLVSLVMLFGIISVGYFGNIMGSTSTNDTISVYGKYTLLDELPRGVMRLVDKNPVIRYRGGEYILVGQDERASKLIKSYDRRTVILTGALMQEKTELEKGKILVISLSKGADEQAYLKTAEYLPIKTSGLVFLDEKNVLSVKLSDGKEYRLTAIEEDILEGLKIRAFRNIQMEGFLSKSAGTFMVTEILDEIQSKISINGLLIANKNLTYSIEYTFGAEKLILPVQFEYIDEAMVEKLLLNIGKEVSLEGKAIYSEQNGIFKNKFLASSLSNSIPKVIQPVEELQSVLSVTYSVYNSSVVHLPEPSVLTADLKQDLSGAEITSGEKSPEKELIANSNEVLSTDNLNVTNSSVNLGVDEQFKDTQDSGVNENGKEVGDSSIEYPIQAQETVTLDTEPQLEAPPAPETTETSADKSF